MVRDNTESVPKAGPAGSMQGRLPGLLIGNFVLAGSYWVAAVLVRSFFSRYPMWPAPLWVPAGIAMYAVFTMGQWAAPGILLGSFLTNIVSFHGSLFSCIAVAMGNTLAPIVGVALARKRMRFDEPFSRVADVFIFGSSCIANGTISGLIGGSAVSYATSTPLIYWPGRWPTWMMSDTGASLLVVPALLLLRHDPLALHRIRKHSFELLLTVGASIGTVVYLMSNHSGLLAVDAGASFLILLPLLWAVLRFSAGFAYPLFVVVMIALIVATLAGYGPYAGVTEGGKFLVFAQMSTGFGISVLLLGAMSEQHRAAENALRSLNESLETTIEQRTAELRESKQRLEKAAFHDVLTGLPNRRFFEERFAAVRSSAARNRAKFAFLLIDLDGFKQINDTLGHDAGDALLVEAGRRLSTVVRAYDFVARLGGDEFAVLLANANDDASVACICTRIIKALTHCISFNGKEVGTTPSVGISLYPDNGRTWHELYKAADIALYAAKQNGRARWERYHQPLESTVSVPEGTALR